MNFLDYIHLYHICAINNIPKDAAKEMRQLYPEVFPPKSKNIEEHVRFVDGKWISWCLIPYALGDMFHCESVIDFKEITEEDRVDDMDLNIENLL